MSNTESKIFGKGNPEQPQLLEEKLVVEQIELFLQLYAQDLCIQYQTSLAARSRLIKLLLASQTESQLDKIVHFDPSQIKKEGGVTELLSLVSSAQTQLANVLRNEIGIHFYDVLSHLFDGLSLPGERKQFLAYMNSKSVEYKNKTSGLISLSELFAWLIVHPVEEWYQVSELSIIQGYVSEVNASKEKKRLTEGTTKNDDFFVLFIQWLLTHFVNRNKERYQLLLVDGVTFKEGAPVLSEMSFSNDGEMQFSVHESFSRAYHLLKGDTVNYSIQVLCQEVLHLTQFRTELESLDLSKGITQEHLSYQLIDIFLEMCELGKELKQFFLPYQDEKARWDEIHGYSEAEKRVWKSIQKNSSEKHIKLSHFFASEEMFRGKTQHFIGFVLMSGAITLEGYSKYSHTLIGEVIEELNSLHFENEEREDSWQVWYSSFSSQLVALRQRLSDLLSQNSGAKRKNHTPNDIEENSNISDVDTTDESSRFLRQ